VALRHTDHITFFKEGRKDMAAEKKAVDTTKKASSKGNASARKSKPAATSKAKAEATRDSPAARKAAVSPAAKSGSKPAPQPKASRGEGSRFGVKAWVACANMGLGHKRATHPLRVIAEEGVIVVNDPGFTEPEELKTWDKVLGIYERLSRIKNLPIIGNFLFGIMDKFQQIQAPYPRRDLSKPSLQSKMVESYVKKGMCGTMIKKIKTKALPLVTSFFFPAIAADREKCARTYCIITDTDINRAWVANKPRESRIEYLVPCGAAMRRLKQYGVPDERIYMTGFPMPLELLGDESLDILRRDLGERLTVLDPGDRFWPLHGMSAEHFLGRANCRRKPKDRVFTITFAVGGAGAQKEIGQRALASLRGRIERGELKMNLVYGKRPEVARYFEDVKREYAPESPNVRVIGGATDDEYFGAFNECMRTTDVLWTKPSELSFYAGLGLPILMAPTIGSQEDFNMRWLEEIQAGLHQHDPEFADEWVYELLEQGRFAEAAWDGFLKARKYGTYKIIELLKTGTMTRENNPLKR
jgi:hypothetical protein